MARVLLGVSGGIAAYKALELVRLAVKAGHAVRVVQTDTSTRFVGTASFAALTGAPVLTSEFERDPARGAFPGQEPPDHDPLNHLELVRNADAYLIAPASANTIAKLAAGLADNLLTSAALAATCPVLVAPAMNDAMYEHAATRANLDTLRARGVDGARARGRGARLRGRVGGGAPTRAAGAAGGRRGGRPERRPAVDGRAAGPGDRGRHAGADRLGALHRQPILGPHGLRAGRRGRPPRRRGHGDRRQRRAAAQSGRRLRGRGHRGRAQGGLRGALRRLRRPADGRRRGRLPPGRGGRHEAEEGGGRGARPAPPSAPTTPWRRCRPRAGPARRSSASPPSTARTRLRWAAPSSSARAWTWSWSTTSRVPTSASTPPRTR